MSDAAKLALGILGAVVLLLLVVPLLFGTLGGCGMFGPGTMMQGFGDGRGGMMGGQWGALWWILPALFWVALISLAAWAIFRIFPAGRGRGGDPAEGILRERLARGEIGRDEYERGLRTLRGEAEPGAGDR